MTRRVRFHHAAWLVALAIVSAYVSPAAAGLLQWQAEVATGMPAGYTNVNITSPIAVDIGTYSEATGGGISYEFIVNATHVFSSAALMGRYGSLQSPIDQAAFKWEQHPSLGRYGFTIYGRRDYDSGVSHTPGVDTHLVFVNNAVDTLLYVNGAYEATMAGVSPNLSGVVGIGGSAGGGGVVFSDRLYGTIYGVAVYDAALSAAEIAAHAQAWAVPEPGALWAGLLGVPLARRRRWAR
jgi:hypothetical protein